MAWRTTIGDGHSHMRRVTIVGKATYCKNASTIGYSSRNARPGDFVVWQTNDNPRCYGRVAGRIEQSPNDGLEDVTGWVVVLALGDRMSQLYFRFVNPDDIIECFKLNKNLLVFFSSIEMNDETIPMLFREEVRGGLIDSYVDKTMERFSVRCPKHGAWKFDGTYTLCPVCAGKVEVTAMKYPELQHKDE